MTQSNSSLALALITSDELKCNPQQLAALQASVVAQFKTIGRMRHEEALRSLFVGIALHRIKAGLPYGEFGQWTKDNLPKFGDRWVNYLMRLALVFIDKSQARKAELVALPGENTPLTLDTLEGEQRAFVKRAMKFIGDLTISELLDEHGIKEAKDKGGARTGAKAPTTLDPEQLYLFSRDEIGNVLQRAETIFLRENRLQHLAGHLEEVRGAVRALRELADKVEAAAKPMLKK